MKEGKRWRAFVLVGVGVSLCMFFGGLTDLLSHIFYFGGVISLLFAAGEVVLLAKQADKRVERVRR